MNGLMVVNAIGAKSASVYGIFAISAGLIVSGPGVPINSV